MHRRHLAAAGGALALAAPLALAAVLGAGHPTHHLDQRSGSAWVVSPGQGLATLLDGASAQVVATVPVPGTGHALRVAQHDQHAYLVDADVGSVARLDGATFAVGTPVALGTPGASLSVLPGSDDAPTYVVDPQARTAQLVDARTLAVSEEVAFAARPAADQQVVDAAGRLYVVDGEAATLTVLAPGSDDVRKHVARAAAATATSRLTLVQGRPVLVDHASGDVRTVSPEGRTGPPRCLETRAADDVQVLGSATSPHVFAAVSGVGVLLVSATDRDDCTRTVPLVEAGAQADFDPLAQSGRYVFVPDRASGTTVVVDTVAGSVRDRLPLADPGHEVELRAHDGIVFYNDRDGSEAGVLALRGGRWVAQAVSKYDPTTGEGTAVVTPEAMPDAPADGGSSADDEASGQGADQPEQAPDAAPAGAGRRPAAGSAGTDPSSGARRGAAGDPASGGRPGAAGATSTPSATPSAPAVPLTVTLHPDRDVYAPGSAAVVTADVQGTGAPGTSWTWSLTGGPDGDGTVVTAPGEALQLDDVGPEGGIHVVLTVTGGPVPATGEVTLDVVDNCAITAVSEVDLRTSSSATLTVQTTECTPGQPITLTFEPWLSAPESVPSDADGSTDITVERVGPPPASGALSGQLAVHLLTIARPWPAVVVHAPAPPVITGAGCTTPGFDGAKAVLTFTVTYVDDGPAGALVRVRAGTATSKDVAGTAQGTVVIPHDVPSLESATSWTVTVVGSDGLPVEQNGSGCVSEAPPVGP